ncbi:MAG: MFS transporter [Gemmatimonadales bacterium]
MATIAGVSADERKAAIKFIVCLGAVSLFADMTYEGAYSIMGGFLKDLGATATEVGIIAGFGEMIAASLRYFSGKLADRTRAYWSIAIAGYAMNLLVVPALAFVGTWQAAAFLIIAERTGKALRGPARDVLLSDATGKVGHGWGFGLHAAMDQTGAVAGPVLMAITVARMHNFAPAFLRLAAPALLAFVAILAARYVYPDNKGTPPSAKDTKDLPKVYWIYVAAAGMLALGFLDFPLLSYHFENTALVSKAVIPLLYALAMGVNGLAALIFGRLFDKYGIVVLAWGILISMLSVPLGFLGGAAAATVGVCCWALGLGVQDASLRSGIAQLVSMNKRGNAFGTFNAVYGIMWFAGSTTMGLLYDHRVGALVVFGLTAQAIAAGMFFWLKKPLGEAIEANK